MTVAHYCPVCASNETRLWFERDGLPPAQNRVYRSQAEALTLPRARLAITSCPQCGHVFNAAYDAALLPYDDTYDAHVPSGAYSTYQENIAQHLAATYDLSQGYIYDIACGSGWFLEEMVRVSGGKGVGIDPAIRDATPSGSGVSFIKDIFRKAYVTERPSMVSCRHAFEQIPRPMEFLREIRSALDPYPGTPLFLEVANIAWSVQRRMVWDFCHERVSYFYPAAITHMLALAGFGDITVQLACDGQYLWVKARARTDMTPPVAPRKEIDTFDALLSRYVEEELHVFSSIRKELRAARERGRVAVWGMATKGVLFANLFDYERELIEICVDMNPAKVDHYIGVSGHKVESPDALQAFGNDHITIFVMNPAYVDEVRMSCHDMGLNAECRVPNL